MALNEDKKLYHVSSSPHVRASVTTQKIMTDVIIAMLPATAFGVYRFGIHALLVVLATVAAAVISEYLYEYFMKRPITITDGSAVVTGMILALNMPPEIPVWMPMLGAVFAIVVVKQLYGGLGQNFMNPALAARCFLLISFSRAMTDFSASFPAGSADAVSGATPLAVLKAGGEASLSDLFFGNIAGTIGEVSVLMLLIGAAYLLIRGVISIRIPAVYIATVAVFMGLFGGRGFDLYYVACEICAGGLIFGAFFMATDYVTTPITPLGQILFGVFIGILTGVFRVFGASAEGVSYAIIIGNIVAPLIERATVPTPFGKGRYAEITKKLMHENSERGGK